MANNLTPICAKKETVDKNLQLFLFTPQKHIFLYAESFENSHLGEKTETMKRSFSDDEQNCESVFNLLNPCWHLYTPEDFPVILTCEADFKAAMTLLAVCALSFPNLRILTFQWMSNHLHITLSGPEKDISSMFAMLRKYLGKYLKARGRAISIASWTHNIRHIESLKDLRNVIAYNNRNGFLVYPDSTPLTYPWGANRFFFNPDAIKLVKNSNGTLQHKAIRDLFHTHKLDDFTGQPFLDGYIPPAVFCDIESAEGIFRNARHYFTSVSRNLEGLKDIAKEIGESIYYTDDDLYGVILKICRDGFGVSYPALLPALAKVEVARKMYFEYNASAKQISRILKADLALIKSILPDAGNRG